MMWPMNMVNVITENRKKEEISTRSGFTNEAERLETDAELDIFSADARFLLETIGK